MLRLPVMRQAILHRMLPRTARTSLRRSISTRSKPKPESIPTTPGSAQAQATTTAKQTTPPRAISSEKTSSNAQQPISLKSLNAFAVSQASAGGSRGRVPPKFQVDRMSPEYRDKARRITLVIIAAPVAIVMSYMLAMRVWGGKERLKFADKKIGSDGRQETSPVDVK